MAVSKAESIFLGHTPADQRRYLVAVLKHLVKTHPVIHLPAVGQFTLARCAIEAGYDRENIYTSDVSLFSSLLGYLFSGVGIDCIDFELEPNLKIEYDTYDSDIDKAAFLMWIMKVCQMEKIHYMKPQLDDLKVRKDYHIDRMRGQIQEMVKYFKGIHYEIKDLRDDVEDKPEGHLVVVNPPVFAKGYTKMFDFGERIKFDPQIAEFNFSKEYKSIYEKSRELSTPFIWYRSRSVDGFDPREVIYAKEYKVNKVDYWLMTKPELLDDFESNRSIKSFGRKKFVPYKAPMFGANDEIREDSKITFVPVKEQVALYYRDVWAHKLGNTKGEAYYLMLVDGKVFSTLAVMLGQLYRLQSDYVFENYGFSAPSKRYPRVNRLLMWAITSAEFGEVIRNTTAKVNRYWTVKGLRTTCLAKYRHVKLNSGILKIEKRERMPNGMYKIMYWADFRDDTFSDVVKVFLEEEKEYLEKLRLKKEQKNGKN